VAYFFSYFACVLCLVALFLPLSLIISCVSNNYVNYVSRVFVFCISWLLTLSGCRFVGWSRKTECLGLCRYCYSFWMWWGYGVGEGIGLVKNAQ
jgi:hypothetical protein